MFEFTDEPFKPGLEPFGGRQTLMAYPDGDVVVRAVYWGVGEQTSYEEALEKRCLVEELPFYGIPVPHTAYVAAEQGVHYLVTELLNGQYFNQENYDNIPESLRIKAEDVIFCLYDYLAHKIDRGEAYMSDIYGLYQFLYVPDKDAFVLVDLGESVIEERKVNISPFQSEMLRLGSLTIDAYLFFKDDPSKFSQIYERFIALLHLSAQRNGVVIPEGLDRRLANIVKNQDKWSTEFDDAVGDLVKNPANKAYCDRMDALREELEDTSD